MFTANSEIENLKLELSLKTLKKGKFDHSSLKLSLFREINEEPQESSGL